MNVSQIDFLQEDVLRNPYPAYAVLRRHDPVHWHESFGGWLLTRYEDVARGLRDSRFGASRLGALTSKQLPDADPELIQNFVEIAGASVFFQDAPVHTRLRECLVSTFTAGALASLEQGIHRIVEELVESALKRRRFDIVADFAVPLPQRVMAEMLGLSTYEAESLHQRLYAEGQSSGGIFGGGAVNSQQVEASQKAMNRVHDDIKVLVASRRPSDEPTALTQLISCRRRGLASDHELYTQVMDLALAGQLPVTNLIGKGVLTLLAHPEQADRLRRDPGVLTAGIEELLRFESPNQLTNRIALEDLEIRGQRITKGDIVFMMLGAANRDPTVFKDPDVFYVGRSPNPHLAFGHGTHFCLGARLARREALVAFEVLINRMPNLRLDGDVVWRSGTLRAHGPTSVPVVV